MMTAREPSDRVSIAVLLGDGIGQEIVESTMTVLGEAAGHHGVEIAFDVLPAGMSALDAYGSTMPETTLERLPEFEGWILGPVSHHLYPPGDARFVSPSGHLRKRFELFANVRPVRSLYGPEPAHGPIDLVIVRENTEGFYADRNVLDGNGELRPDEDMVISVRVVTRGASMRIAQHAFRLAEARRRHVTVVHKANVLRRGDGLFLSTCMEVAKSHPDVEVDELHVDAFATRLILAPHEFDVIVTTNMFGDILSGEAAGLVGGLGFAPGINCGADHAMAQAAHGSAPDLAGTGAANPVAAILSGQLLLAWLAERSGSDLLAHAAADVEAAVAGVLLRGDGRTPDGGGSATTSEVTTALVEWLGRRAHRS